MSANSVNRNNLLSSLSGRQSEAVCHLDGPLLIVAGPGSGKTRVMAHRIAYLIDEHDVSARNILAGPISNLCLAFLGLFTVYTLFYVNQSLLNTGVRTFLQIFIQINIYLALFNLLPLYPLDGGQIFGNLFSDKYPQFTYNLQVHGPKILLGVILIGIFSGISILGIILNPLYQFIYNIFDFIINLFYSIIT